MKKHFLTLIGLVVMVIGLHAFRIITATTLSGSVNLPGEVQIIRAYQGNDSLRAQTINGRFTFSLRPGTWKVVIDANPPFKDVILDNIQVIENKNTRLNEICLQP